MRRLSIAILVGAVATCLAVAPASIGKGPKAPKQAAGTVAVTATPTTVTPATTTVTVTGNVKANSSCRKGRTIEFSYVGAAGTTALTETAVTRSNGDFTAVLPKPTDGAPATVMLQASTDEVDRKVGSKKKGKKAKKGRKIICLSATGETALTVAP